ncbi:AMP-binding protein [Idiomarina xiamenensis]|uniref:Acyl-CoA synthetase n=1 Tax=Idiomarina xiamenensis 10-D-4 TaxID=740709 RepID=K2L0H0_9GAMM|nr:AMP-binding protein [Idiomarina xiamenensis]EKE83415.1 acyl-CoA synthetase [Idiomarina xiamenensis 10-D-4]
MWSSADTTIELHWTSAEQPVFVDRSAGNIAAQRFVADIERAQRWLAPAQQRQVVLFDQSRYRFAVWFIAALKQGMSLCLPGSAQPDWLAQVSDVDALQLVDQALPPVSNKPSVAAANHELTLTLSSNACFSLFTSGSSGAPKRIDKSLAQLQCEAEHLSDTFAQQLQQRRVLSTVTHQHIYGLLWSLWLPLWRQQLIVSQTLIDMEDWLSALSAPSVLVSSPTHLSRFEELTRVLQNGNQGAIFSSGGLLAADTAISYQQQLHAAPWEIYGSTETGGIGYRQNHDGEQSWLALPRVSLSQDARGCLAIRSMHLANQQVFQTDDRVELINDRCFRLLGRVDRIVKVAEKRVSLTALEQFLQQHPWVSRCAACLLAQHGGRLALVVELTTNGQQAAAQMNKHQLNQTFRQYLLQRFERVVLPRYFRYPARLPENATGKVTQAQLQSLFQEHSA